MNRRDFLKAAMIMGGGLALGRDCFEAGRAFGSEKRLATGSKNGHPMKSIFEDAIIGKISSRCRIVRSATLEQAGNADGRFAATLAPIYDKLAAGGAGIIISGMMGVNSHSRVAPSQIAAYAPPFVEELRPVVDSVHRLGGKLVVQLAHCGVKSSFVDDGTQPLGPSEYSSPRGKPARAMSTDDIAGVARDYAAAAIRCRDAGADGVEIHAAHGYLLSQFLSPFFNRRNDEYGGDIANRAWPLFMTYSAIRRAVGDFPIWVKINSSDLAEGGMTTEESLWVCRKLAKNGIDAVEVSGGISADAASSSLQPVFDEEDEGRFISEALDLAKDASTSVISVCGYRTPEIIEASLNRGDISAVSMSRPLVSEPDLLTRWRNGDKSKARCISCNKCLSPGNLSCKVF